MRADCYTRLFGQPYRLAHHARIAGMEATGDVRRADAAHDVRIGADPVAPNDSPTSLFKSIFDTVDRKSEV